MRRLICLVFAAGALAVVLAGPAAAHAQLISSSPSSGQELAAGPPSVTLQFSEGVRPVPGGVRVIAEDGTRIDADKARARDGVVSLALPRLADGAYVVSWRVVSEDGHPVRGAFTFRVGGTGNQAVAAKLAEQLLASGASSTDVSAVAAILRLLSFAAMAVLIGASFHCFYVDRRSEGVGAGVTALVRTSTGVAAVAGVGSVLIYGPLVTGRPLDALFDGTLVSDSLGDHVGQALVIRTVALVLLGVMLGEVMRRRRAASPISRRGAFAGVLVLAAAAAISQAFTGHGRTGNHLAVALPATVVHVVSMGAWAGGLACILVAIHRGDPSEHFTLVRRFSLLAGFSVGALVVTGSFALWRQAGSLSALRDTPSGRLLLVKLGLVAVLVLAGAKNRRSLASKVDSTVPLTAIRRTIGVEAVLLAGVLGITALVVNLAPARDVLARPVSVTVTTQNGLVDITVDPAKQGPNELHIYALTRSGATRPIEGIEATLSNPSAGVEQLESRVVRAGPNHFQALALDLPLKGTWTVEVKVRVDPFTEENGSASFTLK